MRTKIFMSSLLLVALAATGGLAPEALGTGELAPAGTTQLPFAIRNDMGQIWSGGALVVLQDRFSSAPVFRTFDREGKEISQFTFVIPGASLIEVFDTFARGWDGSLAISGSAYMNDSGATCFLAWVSPDGQLQTVIRTSPVVLEAVTMAGDGTIWVAGSDVRPHTVVDHDQHLIWHYDRSGKLLGSYVPWSSLTTDYSLGFPTMRSLLIASKDRVGWYARNAHTYIEFALDGTVVTQVKTADLGPADVITPAFCADDSLFVGAQTYTKNPTGQWQMAFGILALDRQSGNWNYIPQNDKGGILLGCDGTHLASETTDFSAISWLQPTTGR